MIMNNHGIYNAAEKAIYIGADIHEPVSFPVEESLQAICQDKQILFEGIDYKINIYCTEEEKIIIHACPLDWCHWTIKEKKRKQDEPQEPQYDPIIDLLQTIFKNCDKIYVMDTTKDV